MILLLLFVSLSSLYAESKAPSQDRGRKTWECYPLPVLGYSPETGFMFGLGGFVLNNPEPNKPELPSNLIFGMGAYTTKNQFLSSLSSDWYFREDDRRLLLELIFIKFPQDFYGVGPDTPEDAEESFTPRKISFQGAFLWELAPHLYLGPSCSFSYMNIVEKKEEGLLDRGDIPGNDGGTISAPGVLLNWDTRDSSFYPLCCLHLELKAAYAGRLTGSTKNFAECSVDFSRYWQIYNLHVFALNCYVHLSGGDVPFYRMPRLGGSEQMRGYVEGRYIDKNYTTLQGEYRFPIIWRFGGALFGSIGQVSPSLKDLDFSTLKACCGFGLRFALNQQERLNIRFDVGLSEMGSLFYFNFGEAF